MTSKAPRAGTALRGVYDLLQASKGQPVELAGFYSRNRLREQAVNQLKDTYALDVRHTRRGRQSKGINPQWTLVGAWNGLEYVSYGRPQS